MIVPSLRKRSFPRLLMSLADFSADNGSDMLYGILVNFAILAFSLAFLECLCGMLILQILFLL